MDESKDLKDGSQSSKSLLCPLDKHMSSRSPGNVITVVIRSGQEDSSMQILTGYNKHEAASVCRTE